jgi:RNA polymerase sigma factor (sigma-70 family)
MSEPLPPDPNSPLDRISTHWTVVSNPDAFTLRYLNALRSYLTALLKDPQDAEEVLQEFMLRVFEKGFERATPDQGRFRHYLKAAVRNCALTWLRRRRPTVDVTLLQDTLADPTTPEEQWQDGWRRCLLDAAWRELDRHERGSPGNHAYTVLKAAVDYPEDDSRALAERVSAALGRPLLPDAFRKHLSRARRLFADLLLQQIYETLDTSDPLAAEEELTELGLMPFVRDFLPEDWNRRDRKSAPRE